MSVVQHATASDDLCIGLPCSFNVCSGWMGQTVE